MEVAAGERGTDGRWGSWTRTQIGQTAFRVRKWTALDVHGPYYPVIFVYLVLRLAHLYQW